jgi:hypothetical protein
MLGFLQKSYASASAAQYLKSDFGFTDLNGEVFAYLNKATRLGDDPATAAINFMIDMLNGVLDEIGDKPVPLAGWSKMSGYVDAMHHLLFRVPYNKEHVDALRLRIAALSMRVSTTNG